MTVSLRQSPNSIPTICFVSLEAIKAINAYKNEAKEDERFFEVEKLKKYLTLDEIGFSQAINSIMMSNGEVVDLNPLLFPLYGDQILINSLMASTNHTSSAFKEASEFLNDVTLPDSMSYIKGESCSFTTIGSTLFVGCGYGMGKVLRNKKALGDFLIDCLEKCRSTMQDPALTLSPLYSRFIFINVNV